MRSHDAETTETRADEQAVVRDRLWGALTDRDEYAAAATVFAAMDAGMAAEDVLLDVIAPVQHKVGTEWAANRISVAQEHAATAINDRVIAALAHHPAGQTPGHGGRVSLACVDGEWHALPARLLAEVLRLRGWQVDFLGAQVPTPHLIAHLHQHGPDVVALSCSIPVRLPNAHAAIIACQAAGYPVLAGGAAFGRDGRFARQLGADAWAPDARAAAERLDHGFSTVRRALGRQPVDDLPHLLDQEYTMVSRTAAQLVKSTVTDLENRFPAMSAYTEEQHQHTVEDIAHIVDFLTVALYTDDDALFTDFIGWTAEILLARGVPAASLHPALDLLTAQLNDFPRSQRLLRAATDALAAIASPGAAE
ncbi:MULTISPECIES: B12-binding domain-containing protein [unclassified Mycobacterium]|uniref:cobalamin B12-binding domain-containing protein n=1 Tax=unclassified Mycobacterium TaxID=2642494 RepID=UPI0007FF7B0D|nr:MULTISPECIES: cobalamin-dependent protein [unclassified Mycobacterium]OBG78028.1 cobalamin-binding protein [Mycobacterium sp. E1214]OBH28933.1 cobalamin-binding protein [Mycobacterium sp. E1319]